MGRMGLNVIPIPCLQDNYAYLVSATDAAVAVVIDPSEAQPVQKALEENGLTLGAILNTHHHWDHVGGNEALLKDDPTLPVYAHGSDSERVPGFTVGLSHEEHFEVVGLKLQALHVPGHTTGAVAYCVEDAVFTGDTLFIAGCGRLFEGTPAHMYVSLNEILGALPDATRVYCGHEYTAQSLRFAKTVEPNNNAIAKKLAWAEKYGAEGKVTVPSTIADEKATNPFMRCAEASVIERHPGATPAEVLAAVRLAKDSF
ncbi:hydroxyacylglutathione hydrolase [Endomicrobium sp. AH-315-J14]|nr:hydroxyacylglutathione hydrolase [Endomicrobium sp. AH-315-J14]